MTKMGEEKHNPGLTDRYDIAGSPGQFTARFISPYNTLHQTSGFQTKDEALAWINETGKLTRLYS